jgi:UDP-N-acetylmuramate-alanine ligase
MNKEKEFHKSRIAFMIIQNQIMYLSDSTMSHLEWFESLELPNENFNDIVRGYVKNGKIIYYKGDFEYDEDVLNVAKSTCNQIMEETGSYGFKVYAGVTKGEIGLEWEPTVEVGFTKSK